jgi:two-component system nitrogen regulation sensor histidine kinase NtrY
VAAVVIAAAEWLRAPGLGWAAVVLAACLFAAATLLPIRSWRRTLALILIAGISLAIVVTQRRLTLIERDWPHQLEARVETASGRLRGDLHEAFHLAERLAAAGALAADDAQPAAFRRLQGLIPGSGVESGVAVLDPDGTPWAWAGRQRLRPAAVGDSLAARGTGYYLVLETRRHSAGGRVAVASVLIWAHPAVTDRSRSLAELFRARTEVGLEVYAAGTAPDSPNVFDYTEPTTAGDRLLFSTQPIPPTQAGARGIAATGGARYVTWLLMLLVLIAISLGGRPATRLAMLPVAAWLAIRAPIGAAMGVSAPFSPEAFHLPFLGPLTGSAVAVALMGALLIVAGFVLSRARKARTAPIVAFGWLLAVVAPLLGPILGHGITPPSGGVSMGLWITWQVAVLLPIAGLLVLAGALRGWYGPVERRWFAPVATALAALAGALALFVWQPGAGLPAWYPLLWIPAAVLATAPGSRWATLVSVAAVAGSLSAAITWSETIGGRLELASRDVGRLGSQADAFAGPLLERFDARLGHAPGISQQSAMYTLWERSPLSRERYPARLSLWTAAGEPLAELPLDDIGVPDSVLARLAAGLPAGLERQVIAFAGVPGMHYVLVARIDGGAVLTVAVGPRSALVTPGRLGRLLHPPAARAVPQYQLALAPPALDQRAAGTTWHWRRDGWTARAETGLRLPGGTRQVRAVVELREPLPSLVRGALIIVLDFAIIGALQLLTELLTGGLARGHRWRQMLRSFRFQLTGALAAFFIVPTVAFTAWTFSHFQEEAQRARDLIITQSLRDPALSPATAGALGAVSGMASDSVLRLLSDRINADLALYRGGAFIAVSAPILRELGVVGPLMDPGAYQTLALEGDLEVTRDGAIPSLAERVGYRVVQPGPPDEIGVLASPQVAEVAALGAPAKQLDLALVLLLATLAGMGAAILSAGSAARALSRPVSDLRRSALALGQGQPIPSDVAPPPQEFEPVFGAFNRMAADISASRAALEAARRRTATVLATVATGVVGVDTSGRVLIANRQAVDLLGTPLEEGDELARALGERWTALVAALGTFLADPVHADAATELTVAGRRLALQFAPLGPDVSGVVLALNDITDLSRAERVLAWGEMARQVAHEIKNPLTPVRLGIQHLQRAHRDRRPDFDQTLDDTARRILSEIDRLDTIARAFSRFVAPGAEPPPLERLDLVAVATEVVQLYRLAGEGAAATLDGPAHLWASARRDEVKEVLVNLLENARNAGASHVGISIGAGTLTVSDDGAGIPPEQLPRIFEPRFSTTTSGSGLGLPIVRRLVESWGGTVEVESEAGRGTAVRIVFAS